MSWTTLPEAVPLIAECASGYPSTKCFRHNFKYRFGECEERYTGTLVAKLNGIRDRHGDKLIREADASGDYTAFNEWCEETVTRVIDEAIAAARKVAA